MPLRDLLPRRPVRMRDPHSVGVVDRQYANFPDVALELQSGRTLVGFTLAYETYGKLNDEKTNAILICHALSGDSHVAGFYTDDPDEKPGWWDETVGPGKCFDTDQYFVICANVIGGCRGSTGPASLAADGKPYGLRFPVVTITDMVVAQTHLLDHLGIEKLFAVAGGSMGGMQTLEFAIRYPERIQTALFIASTPISSAQNIAFNEIGRQAIYADLRWNKGEYYENDSHPDDGLAVARMVGHITYMSEFSLEQKFGRRLQNMPEVDYSFNTEFAVESYLRYQGFKFTERFDANSYLYITKALDYYDVSKDFGSIEAAVQHATADFLVVSFSSDWLYTADQAQMLVQALENTNSNVEYHHVTASFGHDSFLVEVETMTQIIGNYLTEQWQQYQQEQ